MIGETISHYRLIGQLGAGGMGIVYEARDTNLDRRVALKFLHPESTRDADARSRFVNEAKAASSLDDPNICTIYEIGQTPDEQLFIAMACYLGETLNARLARAPVPLEQTLEIGCQIARGLAKAHDRGIVHRDIKSANIFLNSDGVVKILDFGLAKLRGQTAMTRAGTTLGTVSYISPEQARGERVDRRTDIWSLGVILYEMATGRLPFSADYEQAVVYAILNNELQPPRSLCAEIPPALESVIIKALAKDPEERYQSMDDLLVDLRAVHAGGETPQSRPETQTGYRPTRRLGVAIVLVVFAAVLAWFGREPLGRALAPAVEEPLIRSVAVLPFENLMADPSQDFLVDGMHEVLITDLSMSKSLKVISRTSVMRYRESERPIPEIAEELNVDGVIEGAVLRIGNQLRITVRLVEAATDRQVWAQTYERDLTGALELQRQVALAIVGEIESSLSPQAESDIAPVGLVDPAAFEAYLLGRHFWNKRATESMLAAVEHFSRAIEIAPDYAEAYTGLSDAYAVLAINDNLSPRECFPLARVAARRALALNPNLAEAHVSLAYVKLYYDRDWAGAEQAYTRAIELNPNYSVARHWYAMMMETMGRFGESLAEIERARQLDPLSPLVLANVARRQAIARRYDEAMATAERALAMDPDHHFTQDLIAEIYMLQGKFREHARQLQRILTDRGEPDTYGTALLTAYETDGELGYWTERLRLDSAGMPASLRRHSGGFLPVILAKLGRMDEAFAALEKGITDHRSYVIWLKVYPMFDVLRDHPRYPEVLRRVGLEP